MDTQRHDGDGGSAGESRRTVLTAVVANLLLAVAKGVAALFTGSAALWAECAHSVADTGNEVLLFVGLRRSTKEKDPEHPLGYGRERFLWGFLASLGIFLIGGVLSIGEGVNSLLNPEPLTTPWVGIVVLTLAAVFEGYSWFVARRQLHSDARRTRRSVIEHLNRSSDPSATTVYLEDSAALIGVALALAALLLHLITGSAVWDAAASILIGMLLIAVAIALANRSKELLVDESAPDDVVDPIREVLRRPDWVAEVRAVDAIFVGPSRLLVIAELAVTPDLIGAPAGELIRRIADLRADLLRDLAVAEIALKVVEPAPDTPVRAGATGGGVGGDGKGFAGRRPPLLG
jgi:cation diffusion facilitator family transporter